MPKKSDLPVLKKNFQERNNKQEIIDSATSAIRIILSMVDVLEIHKKEMLSDMIWKISEANGKWNTQYYSVGTLKENDVSVYHEHVVSRKELIARLLKNPDDYREILSEITACIVTKSEHDRLEMQKEWSGWDRYKCAGVKVYDRKQRKWIT